MRSMPSPSRALSQAATMPPSWRRVFVLDSLSTGPEQYLLAEHLQSELAAGHEFDAVCEEMLRYHKHTHLLFSLESLANLARNGRVKPAVAAVARMLGIRVIGQASEIGELDVLCKTRGEHGALERIVLELKGHGYNGGKLQISHCDNPAAAERLKHMVQAVFDGAQVTVTPRETDRGERWRGCSFDCRS